MKDSKPDREPQVSPSRYRVMERPDNGSVSGRRMGPSSEVHKDNPHKRLKLTRHA